MKQELVSIIMPVYNGEKYIETAINSVISQTYYNWELILINDCSDDNSQEIIDRFNKKYVNIKCIKNKKNLGVSKSRNIAISKAQGRYIAFLDSDDIWHRDKLKRHIRFIDKYKIAFSFTSYQMINHIGERINSVVNPPLKLSYNNELKENYIGCSTVIIDIKKIDIKFIQFKKIKHEDYILWLDLLKKGYTVMGLKQVLTLYRISPNSVSSNKIKAALWRWNIYMNVEKLSLVKSVYYFTIYAYRAYFKWHKT